MESVQKGPRKQACLLNQLKSKYIMADAMSAVIRHQSGKLPLAELSSSQVEKKKDVRTIWNLFFKDVLGDTDAQFDVENEQRVELAQDEAGGVQICGTKSSCFWMLCTPLPQWSPITCTRLWLTSTTRTLIWRC